MLASIGKVYTCHTTRRKNKIVEMKVGEGMEQSQNHSKKGNKNHTYVHTLCYVFTVKNFKIYSFSTLVQMKNT